MALSHCSVTRAVFAARYAAPLDADHVNYGGPGPTCLAPFASRNYR